MWFVDVALLRLLLHGICFCDGENELFVSVKVHIASYHISLIRCQIIRRWSITILVSTSIKYLKETESIHLIIWFLYTPKRFFHKKMLIRMTWLAVLFSSYIISLSDKMDPMKKNIREKAMMWKEWKDYVVMQITRLAWQLPRHSAFNSDVQYMAVM